MTTKILVVEDNESLRRDIVEMLGYEGFGVREAENGQVGVKVAQQYLPDLIICDIMMPELDGYGVLDEMQKHPVTATIPFVFLTARNDREASRRAQGMGANAFLTKPFEVGDLMAVIQAQLKKRKAFDDIAEQSLEDLRENIITAVPHELRTPLTGILGFADLLVSDAGDMTAVEIQEMAQYVKDAATRLYRLIEKYLVYAQIEIIMSDPIRIAKMRQFTTANARAVIEDEFMAKAQIVHRESDLVLNVHEHLTVKILDEHLKKIVEELGDNAFKFSKPGTPIEVTTTVEDNHYTLSVKDQGRGMTQQQIKNIGAHMQFGRTKDEYPGIGFGLITAHQIAELHDGKLVIESEPGQGTCISVTLPLA